MQRRLFEELQILDLNINIVKDAYANLDFMLNKLLMAPDKSFEVTFKGVSYDFIYPTTQEENEEMINLRKKLLSELFREVFNQMIDGKNPWDLIRAFASGVDTLDMQIEIVGKEEHLNLKDDNGQRITALPLDESNYQVKQELESDVEVPQQD